MQPAMSQSMRSSGSSFGTSNGFETPSHHSFGASNGDDYDSDGSNFAPPYVPSFSVFPFSFLYSFSSFQFSSIIYYMLSSL